jgi:tricorn protease
VRKIAFSVVVAILVVCSTAFAGVPARFMQFPAIGGDTIVFTYEGDLWSVPVAGGTARRLTNHPGVENAARISPDGRFIAFNAGYDAGANIYVMSVGGGAPRRVTYFNGAAQVVGWTPDSRRIVFRSGHENTFRPIPKLYWVTPDGGYPEQLPVERGVLCSFSPDGTRMVYDRRGDEEYYWKRYKGGRYMDIWLYDFKSRQFTLLTDYVGKNAYPMWIGDRMYFTSDRGAKGITNLYTYDFATKKVNQVTRYEDFDVQWASTDGKRIVFMQAGRLNVLDPASNAVRPVAVEVESDRWQLAERTINPRDYIQTMSVANDGRTAVFEARGDIFVVPADDTQPTRDLTPSPGTRERFPQISPDGRRVAFFSDKTGEYQLYVTDLSGDKPWEPLTTTLARAGYHLEWSPDGTKILFGDKDFSIFYVDVATRKLVKVASSNQMKNDEFYWEVSDYSWSPDSRWITYSFVEFNRNNRVFLYSLDQARSHPITDGFYDSMNPSFDANGEYLYFLSYRNFQTRIDIFEDNHVIPNPVQVMVVALKAGQAPPFGRGGDAKKGEAQPFRIDLDLIERRVFVLSVASGNYVYLKAGKGGVSWASNETFAEAEIGEIFTPSGDDKLQLHLFDMGSQRHVTVDGTISDWKLSPNREQMIVKKGSAYHVTGLERALSSKAIGARVNLDRMAYLVRPVEEWNQILSDTLRWYRDFFYDANMHGRDWKAMGEAYRAWIPHLSSRGELNWMLSQLVGELNVSHTYIGGGDPGPAAPPANPVFIGLLGADLRPDASGYFRFAKIYGPTPYDREPAGPLTRPDIDLEEGEFLIAIDGHEVRTTDNPYRYLQVTRGQKVKVTVNKTPTSTGARTYEVEPVRTETTLRYNRWLADNVEKVLKASNGELGYMHIQAMSTDNIGQFDKFWRAFRSKKGIIIDVRGNGGGWTEYFLIDKLERQMTAYNVLRGMEPFRYPGSVATGPIAVLTNEYNGSDGEAFVDHFKARKLGTVIGVPSWGGLVGILNQQRTLDNGTVEQSNNAFWGRDGKWIVEGHGADPDILLDNDPASASAGRDLQLEKAIEVLQKQIKEKPFQFAPKPPYPIR